MTRHSEPLATCPDCGGLLQPTEPERLTSTEFDDDAGGDADASPRQCLICGYQRPAPAASAAR
jgi:hypothetical protein